MTIQETIKAKVKESMIARNADRTTVLRGVLAAFQTEMMNKNIAGDVLSDADALPVLKRLVKQRKDSIEQFEKGGRADLAESEKKELVILEEFLPAQMSREEVLKIATALKEKMAVTDRSKLGQFVGAVMKETKGQADGSVVKEVVESLFA